MGQASYVAGRVNSACNILIVYPNSGTENPLHYCLSAKVWFHALAFGVGQAPLIPATVNLEDFAKESCL